MGAPHWQSVVDFLVLAAALYVVLAWSMRARAVRIALAVIALFAGSLIARAHRLLITSWTLEGAALLVIAALLIVFQAEVRRTLMRLDASTLVAQRRARKTNVAAAVIGEAAFALARQRIGALIVLVREDPITEILEAGVPLGASVSAPLLEALFQKNSPLHDGAVIVAGDRLVRAAAVLPLTGRADVPFAFGTRHRAAMGLAERCDALVVAVSEERGQVSVMDGRQVRPVQSAGDLADLLYRAPVRHRAGTAMRVVHAALGDLRTKLAALGLASVIWLLAISTASTAVRTIAVPVMLEVPNGLDVTEQSATTVVARLRGPLWILDTGAADGIVAQVNLAHATEGRTVVRITDDDLTLPPGVDLEQVIPPTIVVHLVKRAGAARAGDSPDLGRGRR